MELHPRQSVLVLTVLGLFVFAGCSSKAQKASATTTVPAMTTTTLTNITATTAPRPARSTASTTTTTTTVKPVLVNGIPQVKATPSAAPVGARVRLAGTGFTDSMWRAPGRLLWLAAKSGCGAFAQADNTITVSANGQLTGDFVVPATGDCRQSTVGNLPVTPGAYSIVFACTPCTVGQFEVRQGG
jgi:hypothetical protein